MEMNTKFNYYDILEVDPHSSQNDISIAYHKARLTYSGDNPALYTIFTENEAREYLRMVEEAYSVLSNRNLRLVYDQKLGRGMKETERVTYQMLVEESKAMRPNEFGRLGVLKPGYTIEENIEEEIRNATVFNGPFLRKVREYKNVSLEQLSSVTKISAYYLQSLEKMEAQNLPAPVFVRGYVSQISRFLGLDEKRVVDSYMKLFRESLASVANQ